jgi:hypothetical protein
MAPLSNTATGAPPPAGAWSTMAGMRLLGLMARKSGANCSPLPMLTGTSRKGRPHSSSMMEIFHPLGVGQ